MPPKTSQRSRWRVGLIFLIFFVISLLTNIIGPLVPEVIRSFRLSLTMAAFLPFSFFVAYAVMSIPAGFVVEKSGEKAVLVGAFLLALAGSVAFSLIPSYGTAVGSLFLIGLGMAALQVAINPLLRVAGGEENYAFNAVVVQLVFGIASWWSPRVYSHVTAQLRPGTERDALGNLLAAVVPPDYPWVSIYWIFSAITVAMVAVLAVARFPRVERKDDEKTGAWAAHRELLRRPVAWAYFLAIFSYVGVEQGLSNWMSQFLAAEHGVDPQTAGALAVSNFWGLMTIGCVLGLVALKFFDSRKVLVVFTAAAVFTLAAALFGSKETALAMFPATGFAISVIWSIVFSLALNSMKEHHGTFSGILCTGIVGGAVVPLFIGAIGDAVGLRAGLAFTFVPLAYVLSVGFWARPLIRNKTISIKTREEEYA